MDSSSSEKKKRLWKQSARRVQLAVKTSLVVRSPQRLLLSTRNKNADDSLDKSLFHLHTTNEENEGPYLPRQDYDWLLDGLTVSPKEEREAKGAMKALEESSNWEMLEQRIWDAQRSLFNNDNEEEEEEFGEFQSATDAAASEHQFHKNDYSTREGDEDEVHLKDATNNDSDAMTQSFQESAFSTNTIAAAAAEKSVTSPPPTATSPIGTNETMELSATVDEILLGEQHSSSCCSITTPQLIRKADAVLELFQEQQQQPNDDETQLQRTTLPLPPNDIQTPEAQYIRRKFGPKHNTTAPTTTLQQQGQPQTLIESLDLPGYYFDASAPDDTGQVLADLPWYYVNDTHANENDCWDLWDEHMANELSRLDQGLASVKRAILIQIQPRAADLERASALLHTAERHVRLACRYHAQTSESAEIGVQRIQSMKQLLQDSQDKKACQGLAEVFVLIQDVQSKEAEIDLAIQSLSPRNNTNRTIGFVEECQRITTMSQKLLNRLRTEPLDRLKCLDETRKRLEQVPDCLWERLYHLLDVSIVACCRRRWQTDNDEEALNEYRDILQAAQELKTTLLSSASDWKICWVDRIVQALLHEGERVLALALLEPEDAKESRFEEDLAELASQVDGGWGDCSRLRTITHNLVTIRFDFEADQCYLVVVFQKLCRLLVQILDAHCRLEEWHRRERPDIAKHVEESKERLWRHCENVLHHCLDEYLNFSAKKELFSSNASDGSINDDQWVQDLEQVFSILVLAERFLGLEPHFLGNGAKFTCPSMLYHCRAKEKELCHSLTKLCLRHLRSVHVHAMQTTGRLLSRENWVLCPVTGDLSTNGDRSTVTQALRRMLWSSVEKAYGIDHIPWKSSKSEISKFESSLWIDREEISCLFDLEEGGERNWLSANGVSPDSLDSASETRKEFHGVLESMLVHDGPSPRMATSSICCGLIPWAGRLLTVIDFLPLIVEDVSVVLANLFDLYVVTVLRICSSSAIDERRLLGIDPVEQIPLHRERPEVSLKSKQGASQLFGSFRMQEKRPVATRDPSKEAQLPQTLTTDICSPTIQDSPRLVRLSDFVLRAQQSLRDVVNVDQVDGWLVDKKIGMDSSVDEAACSLSQNLVKRASAAYSCFVVAALADVVAGSVKANLGRSAEVKSFSDDVHMLSSYVAVVLEVTPTLFECSLRVSCARAVDIREVVKQVLSEQASWEEAKLHENPNEYVHALSERCGLLWGFVAASGKLTEVILRRCWMEINAVAYLGLAEGFARVQWCSTEGRALMTLDVVSFHELMKETGERLEERALPFRPPDVKIPVDARYVETYIKVFYYPKEDVISWIEENCSRYRKTQLLALALAAGNADPENCPEVSCSDLIERVKEIIEN